MVIFLAGKTEVATMPGGVVGQISFAGLIEALRRAGEITPQETVSHIRINVNHGTIEFRIEDRK